MHMPGSTSSSSAAPDNAQNLAAANDDADSNAGDGNVGDTSVPCAASSSSSSISSSSSSSSSSSLSVALDIIDVKTGSVITGSTIVKMVGNKIRLGLQSRPPGQPVTNPQWTIPGTIRKNYIQSINPILGKETPIDPADLQAANIDFFWIDKDEPNGAENVSVTATVAGAPMNANVTFTIQRPTVDHFTAVTSSVNLCVETYINPGTWLAAYQPSPHGNVVGCQWDAKVTVSPIGVGNVGLTQLIQPNRVVQFNSGHIKRKASNTPVVDDGLGIQYSGQQSVSNSGSVTLTGRTYADSPGTELVSNQMSSSATDSFQLYLMYQSSEPDSIWVTLSRLTWRWAGQITRIGAPQSPDNNWNAPTGTSLSADPSSRSNRLPQWSTNLASVPTV